MFKLWASIQKDVRLLLRDKVGLLLMFVMPVLLAVLIAAIQNNTFKLVNENKITLLVYDHDQQKNSADFLSALSNSGLFHTIPAPESAADHNRLAEMENQDALAGLVIPAMFSEQLNARASQLSGTIFHDLGLATDSAGKKMVRADSLQLYYSPVLQESFRQSIQGAVRAALQVTENKLLIKNLYAQVDTSSSPHTLEEQMRSGQTGISEITVSRSGQRNIPNATQHNIPAWTVFAMFFVVISLGSSVVKEKLSGSFIRLKTLPTPYALSLVAKQITYLVVTLLQVLVIFTLGIYLFPLLGLPALNLPSDIAALLLVSLVCGWCAVSYAIAIGVFANTQEQANGFGAVTVVILAAIGGLLVPAFAMPDSLKTAMNLSPLHWCLESYYGLFLGGGTLKDIVANMIPLLVITLFLQGLSFWGLKRKNLI